MKYFYPRPPRGGRLRPDVPSPETRDFYPRPPRGGRQGARKLAIFAVIISIHALREEGDVFPQQTAWDEEISIHALREEGDQGPTALVG